VSLLVRTMIAGVLSTLAWSSAPSAQTQAPIRIGATVAQSGDAAFDGRTLLRGYQLCVKHTNDNGGVFGRKLELIVYDDALASATASRLYERLIVQDKVDFVLGPWGSGQAEAAADVTEKHKMPMVAPAAAASSIYTKGRKFIFGMNPSGESGLEGLIDLAGKKGLKTVAMIYMDTIYGRAVSQGAAVLAKKNGLQVIMTEAIARGTTDFAAIMTRLRAANPDVLGGAVPVIESSVALIRQLKASSVNPKLTGMTVGVDTFKFHEILGRDAEFVYGAAPWLPELVEVRAGGLIPVARQYPGAREFVEAYRSAFPGADLSVNSAAAYGACQVLVEAVRRAGSVDNGKVRGAISQMDYNTVYGRFQVDRDGLQVGHKNVLFQWQDGKRAIVWPEELAPAAPRFPTPPWGQRP